MTSRELKVETAEAILQAIKGQASTTTVPSRLLELAQAYAAVCEAAPRPPTSGRSATVG